MFNTETVVVQISPKVVVTVEFFNADVEVESSSLPVNTFSNGKGNLDTVVEVAKLLCEVESVEDDIDPKEDNKAVEEENSDKGDNIGEELATDEDATVVEDENKDVVVDNKDVVADKGDVVVDDEDVVVDNEQSCTSTKLVSNVTAPLRAKRPPKKLALVVAVIEVSARMFPAKTEPIPIVALDPTCQKTLQG